MSSLSAKIEGLLLVTAKPLTFKELAKALAMEGEEIAKAVEELQTAYNQPERGIHLLVNNKQVQLATNPDHAKVIKEFVQAETTGELTKPSLETLTIIAYRQPITKEELEQIRGINCSLILRNLLIRGLIEEKEIKGGLTTTYSLTMDFLRFLGVTNVTELPDYQALHNHENLQAAAELSAAENSGETS